MVTNQAFLFLIFIINGIFIGLVFDFFRILRRSFKTCDLVTYIEDMSFWIITGIIILYSIFTFNNGEIRLFMFLGIFLGCFLYMILMSSHIIKINVFIINVIKNIIGKIIYICSYPLKLIYIKKSKYIFNFLMHLFYDKKVDWINKRSILMKKLLTCLALSTILFS